MLDSDKKVDWIAEEKREDRLWQALEDIQGIEKIIRRTNTNNEDLPERVILAMNKIREAKELLELEAGINWIVAKSVDKLTEIAKERSAEVV